jgi:LDH2 family malate/lactate/ureidoglycolate dehydrogenase
MPHERRLAEGIPLAEETWRQIVETAKQVGVVLDEAAARRDASRRP